MVIWLNDDETLKPTFRSLAIASYKSFSKVKRLKLVSIRLFLYDLWRKYFSRYVNWPSFFVYGQYMCILILCFRGCGVIIFEKNAVAFLSSHFPTWFWIFKYLKIKKSFEDEISIFRHFYTAKQTFLEDGRPTLRNLYVLFKEKVVEIECRENLKIKMLPGFKLLETRKISLE